MMKTKSLVTAMLLIVYTPLTMSEENEIKRISSQHSVILSLSALFYCGFEKWPASLEEVKKFQEVNEINLAVVPDWDFVFLGNFKYENDENYSLSSNATDENQKNIEIRSGQGKPFCENGNTQLQGAFLNIEGAE